jgi:hypothetical protein
MLMNVESVEDELLDQNMIGCACQPSRDTDPHRHDFIEIDRHLLYHGLYLQVNVPQLLEAFCDSLFGWSPSQPVLAISTYV